MKDTCGTPCTRALRHALYVALAACVAASFLPRRAQALEQIVRPYWGIRSAGLGGCRYTTGLYDENFFGNPARVAENPERKIQLLDIQVETSSTTIGTAKNLGGSSADTYSKIAETAGDNSHGRIQTVFPAIYVPEAWGGKWAWGVGLISSTQFDVSLRRSYRVNPQALTDIGPALSVAKRMLPNESLAVGVTAHATYRLSTKEGYSLVDLIRGVSIAPASSGGEGAHLDFDIGTTYVVPWQPGGWRFSPAIAINNLLGGRYSNLRISWVGAQGLPAQQPRTLNFGISSTKALWGPFQKTVFALEFTDIGNNPSGSPFRTIHLGSEVRWRRLMPRLGLNQGYLSAGLGIDLRVLELDLATYGEEMSLNAGGNEDRRFALRVALRI